MIRATNSAYFRPFPRIYIDIHGIFPLKIWQFLTNSRSNFDDLALCNLGYIFQNRLGKNHATGEAYRIRAGASFFSMCKVGYKCVTVGLQFSLSKSDFLPFWGLKPAIVGNIYQLFDMARKLH
jgi:hypothetical protein